MSTEHDELSEQIIAAEAEAEKRERKRKRKGMVLLAIAIAAILFPAFIMRYFWIAIPLELIIWFVIAVIWGIKH